MLLRKPRLSFQSRDHDISGDIAVSVSVGCLLPSFTIGEQRSPEWWEFCPELERSCGLYQRAGVIYSGRRAQELGTGRTDLMPPQRPLMVRTQICLQAAQEIICFSELTNSYEIRDHVSPEPLWMRQE